MNRAASSSLKDVDVILWLVEAGLWTKEDDRVLEHVSSLDCPVILVINKIDKLKHPDMLLPYLQDMSVKYNADEVYPLSAFKKNDVSKLKSMILKYLPVQSMIFDPDFITDRSEKFIVAEFIREKLMRHLSDELPYDLTVEIEKYELDGELQRVSAKIFVDKTSQKNIVIGKNGEMLKRIGTEARKSIEGFLEKKVFLQLWVKVSAGWSDDKKSLSSLGYD
jgi:GTP-binding protein Era